MRLLDRYIFRELLDPFLFGLLSFTLILGASMILFDLVRALVFQGLPILSAGKIFILKLPEVMVYVVPMATLLAALLAFGRFSHDSEVVAFRAGGVSFLRIMVPVFVFGILTSGLTLMLSEWIVPESHAASEAILRQSVIARSQTIRENLFAPEFERGKLRRVLFVRAAEKDQFRDIIVWEFYEGHLLHFLKAETGQWDARGRFWTFRNGIIYYLADTGEYKDLVKFDEQRLAIRFSPEELGVNVGDPSLMALPQLRRMIEVKQRMGERVTTLWIQFEQKIAIPFACLVFALLGAPLGVSPRRVSASIGLGFSVLIIFFYYVAMFFSMALGEMEILPPFWAAWAPNVLGLGAAGYFIRRRGGE